MSIRNGEKARAGLQRRKRIIQRAKSRAGRAAAGAAVAAPAPAPKAKRRTTTKAE